jgi:6-phosphogluconolactonase
VEVIATDSDEQAAHRAVELIESAGAAAIRERGRFNFAVSGGKSPWRMFELLSDSSLDWSRTSMFQVDERIAPTGSRERNLTHLVLSLPLACQSAIRPMPVGAEDLEAAAAEYEYSLPDRLDLIHLGIGPDGHTASLVPDDPVLEVDDRAVALTAAEYQGSRRMTLTYPAIERARKVFFLILDGDKREAFERLLDGDRSIPAGRVSNPDMVVVTDIRTHAA